MQPISKLRWHCRRGMRELDILFLHYLDEHYAKASGDEQLAFETLIDTADPIITDYIFNRQTPPTTEITQVIMVMQGYLDRLSK